MYNKGNWAYKIRKYKFQSLKRPYWIKYRRGYSISQKWNTIVYLKMELNAEEIYKDIKRELFKLAQKQTPLKIKNLKKRS